MLTAAGGRIPLTTNSQTANSIILKINTALPPTCCINTPPIAAPKNAPKNCTLLYTPIAVPLAESGAILLIIEGKVASSTLNAVKKINKAVATPHRLCCANINTACAVNASATAAINTCFILALVSATMIGGTINTKAISMTGKYICQCCATSKPSFFNTNGTCMNTDIKIACKAKIPKSKRSNSGLRNTSANLERFASVSVWKRVIVGLGITKRTNKIAENAKTPVNANIPGTPSTPCNNGERIKEIEKVSPIVMPIIAIALVRTSSRVKSAVNAITAALIAPAPCIARPTMTQ